MGSSKGHIPIRTCISCGSKKAKSKLIRFYLDKKNQMVRDESGIGDGRGIYVCHSRSCVDTLKKNKRLSRAFRKSQIYLDDSIFIINDILGD